MAKKKLNLAELTDVELVEKLKEDNGQLTKLRFNHAVSPIENPMRLKQMRRDVARIYSEITKRKAASKK